MTELLKKFNVFEGLENEELQKIAEVCKVQTFKKGDQIFRVGDPADSLFLVNKGKIELRFQVNYHNVTAELAIDKVSEGEAFGWSAFAPPFRYTLQAFVAEDSELVQIKECDLKRICQSNSQLGYLFMNNIAKLIGERFSTIQGILIQEIQQSLKKKESLS